METKSNILANYPHLQDALLLLLVDIEEDEVNVKADGHHGADMSDGFSSASDGIPDRDYVLGMISLLRSLTCAARHGIESCLLHQPTSATTNSAFLDQCKPQNLAIGEVFTVSLSTVGFMHFGERISCGIRERSA
ncbi:hypothetical protein MY8738_001346 [Beauveria namnaoensis]